MKSLDNFSVQPVNSNSVPDKAVCIHVEARSPLQAAEMALGETLVTQGPSARMRAMVWKLADDYTPVSIPLFVPG